MRARSRRPAVLLSRSLLTTCYVVAIVGSCTVGAGWIVDNPHRGRVDTCPGIGFFFVFAPTGCGAICVAMTVLAVVAFGAWAGLGIGVGLALVLAGFWWWRLKNGRGCEIMNNF